MNRRANYVLSRSQWVAVPLEDVFAFFADAGNLQLITPDFLDFSILTPMPVEMRPGTELEYRLKLFRIPFGWKTEIKSFDPPYSFVDLQIRGPYQLWHHLHRFEAADGGTWIHDQVDYRIGWGPLGPLAHAMFVKQTLETIFDFRQQRIGEIFAAHPANVEFKEAASHQIA